MKRFFACLLALGLLLTCAGCLQTDSPEHFGYALAIGFDRGETMPYVVSLLLQKTKTDSESQNNSGFLLVKSECRSLLEAAELLSASLPLEINFARTALIVINLSLLTEAGMLEELLDVPVSRLRIRYNTMVLSSVTPAYDTLEGLSNELDPSIGRICANLESYRDRTGLLPLTNLTGLFEAMRGELYDAMIPLCGVTNEAPKALPTRDSVGTHEYAYIGGSLLVESSMKTSLAGAVLLRGGRMAGFLDGQNVQLAMMIMGDYRQGRRRIVTPSGMELTVFLRADKRPRTRFTLSPIPSAAVTIPLVAYVEAPGNPDSTEQETIRAIQTALKNDADNLLACCKRLGCDTLRFGTHAVKCFRSTEGWEAYRWKTVYPAMRAQFDFDVTLLHSLNESELE